ncbi:MAG: SOS response-associated peptidase family protein [Luteolibacter sp.]
MVAIGSSGRPTACAMRWGFKDPGENRMHLTAVESVRLPKWAGGRRAVVPAISFYETDWQREWWSFHQSRWEPMWLAGLWHKRSDGLSFTLFTKPAVKPVKDIHDRMACPLAWDEAEQFLAGDWPPGRASRVRLSGLPALDRDRGKGRRRVQKADGSPKLFDDDEPL